MFQQEESEVGLLGGGNGQLWTLGLGLLATALAAAYVTRLAKVICLIIAMLYYRLNAIKSSFWNLDLANMELTHNHEIYSIIIILQFIGP